MASVRWTLGSQEDLREIVEYISQDSTAHAAAMGGRIVAAVERLP
ncbi:MAG: type II toxin-antitoxin system RelE/ParE family toxin [candidate division NC10 bacterium]|nr:type II toxin-antitoxin system RelE/ParE family toxin [candidate division NC10 bacterium]MBI2116036.1 type II toxin-antitoxin system RelE/ParE family toxin [candidate division NC10 bacterium]MBI2456100.1 type II toxin-antitoxin system RelE/ParE family toxin [candidate division NC10 bacterium]MBI2561996.1 type II toxin-antitoxin system RelE/ParE family toxin [candidate division NC10 bacterium]